MSVSSISGSSANQHLQHTRQTAEKAQFQVQAAEEDVESTKQRAAEQPAAKTTEKGRVDTHA
jgi:hypothetical protein